MARAWKADNHFVIGHGILMLCLGMALFSLAILMTNPRVETPAYTAAVLLTIACLLGPALLSGLEVLAANTWRDRPFHVFLLAAAISLVCWLVLWLIQPDPLKIRFILILAGLHGLFWGAWHARLAFSLHEYPKTAAVLCVLAAITTAAGIIIATQSALTSLSAVTAVACYTTWIGIQILSIAPFLLKNWEYRTEGEVHSHSA